MDERKHAIDTVNAALVPLRKIDELYSYASSLSQQTTVEKTAFKTRNKKSWATGALVAYIFWRFVVKKMHSGAGFGFSDIVAAVLTLIVFLVVKRAIAGSKANVASLEKKNDETIEKISAEIEEIAKTSSREIGELPRDYRYYYAVNFFENVLANGRADSMKEAINLFEVHLHQMKVENQNQQLLYINEQQTKMLAEIEYNTSEAVRAINRNTAFDVLSYLSR